VFTVTVVEAEVEDAMGRRLLLEEDQDENENGPVGEAKRETLLPESYQPSAVGEAPRVAEYVPVRVVTRLHVPEAALDIVEVEVATVAPAQVLEL